MATVSRSKIEEIIEEFNGMGSGESSQVADWLDSLLENDSGRPDTELFISSLEELKTATDAAIKRIREL